MDRLIRSYLEQAVLNGESWDSGEDPNDVISAQDLLNYFDSMVRAEAKLARLLDREPPEDSGLENPDSESNSYHIGFEAGWRDALAYEEPSDAE